MSTESMGDTANRPRRARDRGFQRPSGPALVAKPEPLTPMEPATTSQQERPGTVTGPRPDESSVAMPVEPPEPQPGREPTGRKVTTPKSNPSAADAELPMPTPRHSEIRVQFNTKLRPAVIDRTKGFAEHYRANIQEIVEQALDEYLTRRGWDGNRKR